METKHISFSELFDYDKTGIRNVVIPKIQRAYAQGRTDARTTRTRERFLDSIHETVSQGKSMTLDFIYGNNANGTLTPLDGQQRLTTLFLLHWYAARKAGEDTAFLRGFSYDTRYSARDFCSQLLDFVPEWNGRLSEEIIDQVWFPLDWRNDATVAAMLVMLDAINEKFGDVDSLWVALSQIKFFFLPIEQMGLTDDIYIKMNSRGKPLTDFEHFKAEFEKALNATGEKELAKRIICKIDIDWTDMLWPHRGDNNIIDDEFLRYFRFVCDILCYRQGGSPKQTDEFDLIKKYFTGESAVKNFETVESFFDCWMNVDHKGLFDEFIATEGHESGKILLRQAKQKYLFEDCLNGYADVLGNRNRRFTLNQIILLYAFSIYLQNDDKIGTAQFGRRLRILYNLILNSSHEISDSETRTGGNRMPAIIKQVDSIVLGGVIIDKIMFEGHDAPRINFNVNQIEEEKLKMAFVSEYPHLAEALYTLEDHDLLQGQIGIVGLDHPERFERFAQLFECDWDKICCALISIGECGRHYRGWRLDLGTSDRSKGRMWNELFNISSIAKGYDSLKDALAEILDNENIDNQLLDSIAGEFLNQCETNNLYPWRYYYVKYRTMRPGAYGRYMVYDKPYELYAMLTEKSTSTSTFSVFLNELGRVDRNSNGQCIIVNEQGDTLWCKNGSYDLVSPNGDTLNQLIIPQKGDIDAVDRVLYAKEHFQELINPWPAEEDPTSEHDDTSAQA